MTPPPPTDRQDEVWSLWQQGFTKAQIAAKLGISQGTVHNHIARYSAKFGKRP